MTFIGMMRVRDEARWIYRAITSLLPLCDFVYVLNDHSEDETAEIASSFDQCVVLDSPFAKDDFSETRDKTWLLQRICETSIDDAYVISIDGDEELEVEGQRKIKRLVKRDVQAAFFRIAYLWDKPSLYRTDGNYGKFERPSMFRLNRQATEYHSLYGDRTTMHCTNVPYALLPYAVRTDIYLKHWGYFDRETRVRKYDYYAKEMDPGNADEDYYRHMVIGDVFPVDSVFKHGGPLKLETLAL